MIVSTRGSSATGGCGPSARLFADGVMSGEAASPGAKFVILAAAAATYRRPVGSREQRRSLASSL